MLGTVFEPINVNPSAKRRQKSNTFKIVSALRNYLPKSSPEYTSKKERIPVSSHPYQQEISFFFLILSTQKVKVVVYFKFNFHDY